MHIMTQNIEGAISPLGVLLEGTNSFIPRKVDADAM